MQTPLLITVRFSSSRLPGKCLLEVEGVSVLQHLVERLIQADFKPTICTSTDPADDAIVSLAQSLQLKYFRGSLLNKIERWADCASQTGSNLVHILDADDPFVDVEEISTSIEMARDLNLDLLRTSQRSDSGYASVGMTVKTQFLQDLKKRVERLEVYDLDVIPWHLILYKEDRVQEMPNKYILSNRDFDLRLTLDYPEDFQLIGEVLRALGNGATRKEIEEFLYSNPEISKINSLRTLDFLNNKKILLQNFSDIKAGNINA